MIPITTHYQPPPQPPLRPSYKVTIKQNQVSPADKSFAFLKDGVHFPPIPSTPPPFNTRPPPQAKAILHEKKMSLEVSTRQRKTYMELAVEVLPSDTDLDAFLQSPQLQMAWYTNLMHTQDEKQAILFKEVVVSMQQSPELLQDIKELVKSRSKMSQKSWSQTKRNSGPAEAVLMPSSASSILMPSASSADTFYTLANAAAKHQEAKTKTDYDDLTKELTDNPIVSELLRNSDNESDDMNSMASSKSPSNPLYKRKASESQPFFDFPDSSYLMDPPQPWSSELGTRSNTMPSSSLSSMWPSSSLNRAANNASPSVSSRTYANVLRQNEQSDPLMKIRHIGTRGSQELYDSSSTSPNPSSQSPFSPFNGKW